MLNDPIAGECLIKSWNVFFAVKHATHSVLRQIDPHGASPTAVKSGLRIQPLLVNEIQSLQDLEAELCQ